MFVEGQAIASGEAQSKIAKGTLEPNAWSPASSLWGRLLNFEADRPLAADDNPSLVRTPLVIAMWEPFARALGWPQKQIGYDQLTRLAVSRRGLRGLRPAGVRQVQARSHQSGLLDLRAVGGGVRVLRGHGQEGGAHRGRRDRLAGAGPGCASSSARSSTTATPRSSSPTSCARAGRGTRRPWPWRRSPCSTSTATAAASPSSWPSIPRRAPSTRTTRSSCPTPSTTRPRRRRARASSRSTSRRRSTRRPPGATASVPRTSRRSRRGW